MAGSTNSGFCFFTYFIFVNVFAVCLQSFVLRRPLDLTSKYEQFLSDKVSKNYNLFFQKILKNNDLFVHSNESL